MKYLLLIIFFPVICLGQRATTTSLSNTAFTFTINDTSKVIMLVSDTVKQIGDWVVLGRNVFWLAGYEVRIPEIYNEIPNGDYLGENRTCAVYGCTANHWSKAIKVVTKSSEIIYLDENKKPLSKSLVIWDVKKLKQ